MPIAMHACNRHVDGMNSELHVIFGTGQIGTRVAQRLLERGARVRMISRTPRAPRGAEVAAGDARDLGFAAEAAKGATVVYDTANPLYQHWKRDLVALGRGTVHAAVENRAKLVALDSLYMYGAAAGPMSETSPVAPVSRKGALRAELAELRLGANTPVAIVRASDFFGTALPASWFGERFYQRAFAGKPVECLGDPDQLHSYTYAKDVAAALVQLGSVEDTGVWHVPTLPAITSRALVAHLGRALNLDISMKRMSRVLLRALGVVLPFMRELPELAYQWEVPFVIDDAKYRARFGTAPTPLADQLETVAAWARRTYQTSARKAA
jgi:nucleoside-diphosphate-sugar epimerase